MVREQLSAAWLHNTVFIVELVLFYCAQFAMERRQLIPTNGPEQGGVCLKPRQFTMLKHFISTAFVLNWGLGEMFSPQWLKILLLGSYPMIIYPCKWCSFNLNWAVYYYSGLFIWKPLIKGFRPLVGRNKTPNLNI